MWATTLQSFDTFISHWLHEFCTRHRQKSTDKRLLTTWQRLGQIVFFRFVTSIFKVSMQCDYFNFLPPFIHLYYTYWIPVKGFQIEISLESFLQLSVFLIILTPDWHIISCSKGSGCKDRKWRFPTCREGVTICGKPHLPLVFLSLLLKPTVFHSRLGSLENKP